jgi:hypothetical protein
MGSPAIAEEPLNRSAADSGYARAAREGFDPINP